MESADRRPFKQTGFRDGRVSPNPLPTDHAICFTPAAIAAHAAYAGPLLSSQTDVSGNNVRFVSD